MGASRARSTVELVEAHLAEAEIDCASHTIELRLTYLPPAKPTKNPKIIAGLLRELTEHTDGFCAMRGATDQDFIAQGMVFRFTSNDKRAEFRSKRLGYLSEQVRAQISIAEI